ncbi:MAG TPA: alcohol dehydrogenase catalytic domain-containing protein [Acidimicrobiales bacterium]|nr:alcohol dehydrogenase catalytic domain-containing protein [Acidimicrobiales bacterium]
MGDLPEVMLAAVYRAPGRIEVEEVPVPRPGPGEVLVEVGHCGVCGSDVHLMVEGWGRADMVGGHEFSGTVAALGPDAGDWRVGDVVVGGPSPRCGTCRRCREGRPSQCEARGGPVLSHAGGAFARYTMLDHRAVVPVPEGMDPRVAALAEPLAVALHGITRAGLVSGDSAMVFGAGPIGALTVAALLARGVAPVRVVEPNPRRRALAGELGAHELLEPDDLETYPPWEPERISARAVDAVLECSGKRAAMEAGLHQLCRGGRLVLVGAGMEAPSFDPNRLLLNELVVCGSFVYDHDGFDRAMELLASGAIDAAVLVEPEDVGLDGLGEALSGLASGAVAGKVMVVPDLLAARR